MATKPEVIRELRSMFKVGATPSRLIQHIVERHPEVGNWHGLIQDYFREAFAVSIIRGLSPSETYSDFDLRFAYLNEDLLHEMVQTRGMWDHERSQSDATVSAWLNSLTATSPLDRLNESKQASVSADLSEGWSKLSEDERNAIVLANAGYKGRTEMVRILARLAEQLQQRIVALEQGRQD